MKKMLLLAALFAGSMTATAKTAPYDYFSAQRLMIRNGVQAVLMCNGLFTSQRTLRQVFDQELRYLANPVGNVRGGDYEVDTQRRAVFVGGGVHGQPVRAVFRTGIGCVVMAPDQSVDDIAALPESRLPALAGDPDDIDWPDGDRARVRDDVPGIDRQKLKVASDWAFDRASPEQVTLSLLVVHGGNIVHERYADGVDRHTRTRTWSTAKSIGATLIGMLVDEGRMHLDRPVDIEWLPVMKDDQPDPRDAITLRQLLNMSSGLYPVDSFGMEYATGSGLAYWAGASSVDGARTRGLIRTPGSAWEYENYDTLLAVKAMKNALGNHTTYLEYPRRALLDRIGMRNTLLSTDRFGDFILSSQVYTNARDLARFGLLYLNEGMWGDERLLSKAWIDFVRTPAPATKHRGNFYGGQWWLVPDNRTDVPADAYATAGNRGQYVIVVPSHDLVIVRRGLDYGKQGFNRWDLTAQVLEAFTSGASSANSPPDWLAGRWCVNLGEQRIEEMWLPARGDAMLGVGRTMTNASTVAFEYLRIASVDGVPTLFAQPGGSPAVSFARVAGGETWARFANPQHDYPQTIEYRRRGDALEAVISGAEPASDATTFDYRACDASGQR